MRTKYSRSAFFFLFFGVFVASFLSAVIVVRAADLNFTSDTILNLSGVTFTTVTVAAGSEATTLIVGTSTFTVTVPSGSTFTVNASSDITFTNDGGVTTTCGTTSSLVLTGPKTSVVVTPTDTVCLRSGSRRDSTPPSAPTGLRVTSNGTSVTLTWKDPLDADLKEIEVLRNSGLGEPVSGTLISSVTKGVQTFTDTTVTRGKIYKYAVRAVDTSNNVADSAAVDVNVAALALTTGGGGGMPVSPPAPSSSARSATPVPPEIPVTPAVQPSLIESATREKIQDSAAEFGVHVRPPEETLLANFVMTGTLMATKRLGSGERLAVVRDTFETIGRVSMTAIEQVSNGEKPTDRNLVKEQARVGTTLVRFKKILGVARAPNFKNTNEDLAWNTLLYRIRFPRDLAKEQQGIARFKTVTGETPRSPFDWATVRAYGYNLTK